MFLLRILLPFAVLWVLGLVIAWAVTRDRKYLRLLWWTLQLLVLLVVSLGLVYLFERVLLMA